MVCQREFRQQSYLFRWSISKCGLESAQETHPHDLPNEAQHKMGSPLDQVSGPDVHYTTSDTLSRIDTNIVIFHDLKVVLGVDVQHPLVDCFWYSVVDKLTSKIPSKQTKKKKKKKKCKARR